VLLVGSLLAIWLGGVFLAVVLAAIFAGAYREWEMMVGNKRAGWPAAVSIGLVAVSIITFDAAGFATSLIILAVALVFALIFGGPGRWWRIAGMVIMVLAALSIQALRGDSIAGVAATVFLGTVVWGTDSAAFFTGRQVGGQRLFPEISPSKTWSGALGGLVLGAALGLAIWLIGGGSPWWAGLGVAVCLSICGQLGDLAESAVKRIYLLKDSSDLIPGHGGLMDRIDSLTFAAILAALIGGLHSGFDQVGPGLMFW
jgi:phosphatidate cytidylyltransferase